MNDDLDADLLARAREAFSTDVGYAIAIAEAANKVEARRARQVIANQKRAVSRVSNENDSQEPVD